MLTNEIRERLFLEQDLKYKEFQLKLMPGVKEEKVIGVRTPILKKLAKEYAKHEEIDSYLRSVPRKFYDEYNLAGFIISELKDYDKVIEYIDLQLPFVDNWATCDLLSPKIFKKNRDRLKADIERWFVSNEVYTKRFAIEMIMSHYLDNDFDESYLPRIASFRSDEYYINMMVAWFFATALAKQWDSTIKFIENRELQEWTHKKTIQKAIESYRITDEQKEYLRTLK